jgi:hypothetical protein
MAVRFSAFLVGRALPQEALLLEAELTPELWYGLKD